MYPMRKTYLAMIFCFIFITSSARPGRNEISVGISGGISALHYSVSEGKFKPQGRSISQSRLFIKDNRSLGESVQVPNYLYTDQKSTLTDTLIIIPYFPIQYRTEVLNKNTFDFRFTYTDFREEQKSLYLNIPIFFQLQVRQPFGNIRKSRYKNRGYR